MAEKDGHDVSKKRNAVFSLNPKDQVLAIYSGLNAFDNVSNVN